MAIIILISSIQYTFCQWPEVKNIKKAHALPSLEVKIHPPDEFQPKVQAEIRKLEELREKNEREWMAGLETAYNAELAAAAGKINTLIKDALAVFDDNNLLMKSVEYAINPPTLVIAKKQTSGLSPSFRQVADFTMNNIQQKTMKALVADDNGVEKLRNPKVVITMDKPKNNESEKKLPDIMKDNTKYRFAQDKKSTKISNTNTNTNYNNQQDGALPDGALVDGAIPENQDSNISSFLEMGANFGTSASNFLKESNTDKMEVNVGSKAEGGARLTENLNTWTSSKTGAGKYTKPISVLMKMPAEPDASIQSEMGKLEKKRDGFEKKIFDKAKKEFKLITEVTTKELQVNLQHELVPFFVVSKNELSGIKNIVKSNFEKEAGPDRKGARFVQLDDTEVKKKYPYVNYLKNQTSLMSQINLNKHTYEKVLGLFADSPENPDSTPLYQNLNFPTKYDDISSREREENYTNELKKKIKSNLRGKGVDRIQEIEQSEKQTNPLKIKQFKDTTIKASDMENLENKSNSKPKSKIESVKVNKKDEVEFDNDACLALASKFENLNLNCTESSNDFQSLKTEYQQTSFIEVSDSVKNKESATESSQTKGGDDFINVKFAAADDPYPTIEKLTAQMETRRDLAEKFERLKILEFETHLQKAENEMIQDVLHENLYRIMAKFGPAIEGIKERL